MQMAMHAFHLLIKPCLFRYHGQRGKCDVSGEARCDPATPLALVRRRRAPTMAHRVDRGRTTRLNDVAPSPDEAESQHSLGAEIRALRKVKGLTLVEMAEQTGKSIGYLSQVERDITKPSVKVLQQIGEALGVDSGWFYPPGDDVDPREARFIVRARNRRRIAYSNLGYTDYLGMTDHLLSANLEGRMALGITTLKAGASTGDDAYSHGGEDAGYVLEGRVELTIDGEVFLLEPGDSYSFQSELPHRFYNPTRQKAVFLWAISPIAFRY